MASTIKLKTSTSSGNVPASLSKGELAINVTDGVWYYGGASAVQQNFTFGSVTVTGDTSLDGKLVVTGNTVMNGTLSASSVNVGNGAGSVSAATITSSGNMTVGGDLDVDGVFNVDNMDIDGTFTMDGTTFDVNATTTLTLDNTNTTNGIAIGTSTSGVPIQLGHSTSETRVNDNLVVTGNTVMNGTLSATTSCKIGNGDGLISAATVSAPVITGTLSTAAQTNITSLGTLTNLDVDNININSNIITSSADMKLVATGNDVLVDTDNFTIESATAVKPSFTLKSTVNSNKPANQAFVKDKGAAGADGDFIGETYYIGDNDAQEQITMVQVTGKVSDASDGAEEGEYVVNIKNTTHASTLQESFKLTGNGALTDATIGFGATSTTTIAGDLAVTTDLDVDGVTNLDNTDIDGTFTMDGTAFDVNGTTTVAIDNTNTTNGVTINTVTSGSKVFIGHTTSETTVNDNLSVTGDLDVDGTTNLDEVDVDGDITMANGKQLFLGSGTIGDPTITFLADTDTGIRLHTAGSMRMVVAGADQVAFSDGSIFPLVGNDIDLGLSSGYYFKDLYIGNITSTGTTNLDNTDIDGTLVVDGTNISLDSTSTLNIDNSNTSNGITIGTATSGVPIQLGHSTSTVRINDNLVVTGNTVMNGTLSATTSLNVGNGNGTISASSVTGTILRGILGSDASPVTAYINNGEIDGTTLGGESAVTIAGANYIDITNSAADNVALSVIGHASQSASILEVKDGGDEGTTWFGVAANGRCTISSGVMNGGTINNTSIGATTRNTGAFTTLNANSTLVVTGNTTLNGTLSATTSCKVGNGDGLVSAATVTAAGSVTLPDNGKVKLGNAGDLEIYHNGSNSFIDDTGTGTLFYRSGTQTFQNAAGSKTMAVFNAASTVDLSFNDSVKLSTNTSGVHIAGTLSANTAVYAGTGVDDGVISANTVNGAYQFISFVGNSGALDSDNWQYPGTNGISNHTWGYEADGSGISTGSSTVSISRTKQMSGIILPAGTRIVGITGAIRSSVDDTGYAGLFTYSPDYGGPDTVNATLRILAQTVDASGGASVLNDPQFFKGDAAFASQYVVQEGDQILPAWRRGPGGSTQTIIGTFTIIVKY